MHVLAAPSPSARVPGRALSAYAVLVAGLAAAFVLAPPRLAATGPAGDPTDRGHLVTVVRAAVVGYWRSGDRRYPPDLQRVVDYWLRFHLIKGGIAALLLVALSAMTVMLWRTFVSADRLGTSRRATLASAGVAGSLLALAALLIVMANIQGALAPFSSLLPLLMGGAPDAGVAAMLAQGRQQLAGSHATSGYAPAALDVMVNDFGRYHAVLAVIAVVVVVALLGLSVAMWRGFARAASANRRARRTFGWLGAASALSSLAVAVVLVANAGTAMDPAPALLGLFNGGF